jgi:hypothetical protein
MAVPTINVVRTVSKFVPKILPRLYRKPSKKNALKMCQHLEKCAQNFMWYGLDLCAGLYGLYGLFSPRKVCLAPSSISVPIKCCTTALKSMPILSENTATVHLNFCAHLLLYGLQKSIRYDLFFLVACCLEICAALCLGMRALLQQMMSLFSSSTSPSSLLLSQQEMNELPKNRCALLP